MAVVTLNAQETRRLENTSVEVLFEAGFSCWVLMQAN